jgi:tRNA (Thr-GGU) A37 N-methylase
MSDIIFEPIGQVKAAFDEGEVRAEGKDLEGELEIYAKFDPGLEGSTVIPIFLSSRILTG